MKHLLKAAVLCLVSGLSSCASIWVTHDYDSAVDFSALKTWSWHAGKPDSGEDEVTSLLSARIRSALEQELVARGCPKVESGGDFQVSFHTVIAQKVESTSTSSAYGYGWRHGHVAAYAAPEVYSYEEGTLIVDFIDPKSNHMIWRGTAGAVVDRQASPETREQRVKDAVQKLIALYPPKSKG
jgi:Domain of unknown function (DUF4136)